MTEDSKKPTYGNYFELLDRTFVSAENLAANIGEHPVMAFHPELKAHYEKAAEALGELYQALNEKMEEIG
ncbi:MAG: hypothetical protein K6L73_14315 [Cellvibrionaceae bacterium]